MKYVLPIACLLAALPALAGQGPLVVVLDPGHGGKWPHDGAHGRRGLHEKVIALQVALKAKEILEAEGATVVLTREDDDDVPFAERARIANESGADVFLSIHCNSMERQEDRKTSRGVETYFLSPDPTDAEARMLARLENGGPAAVPLPKASSPVQGILNDLALGQARNDSAALAQIVHRRLVQETGVPSRGVRQAPFVILSGTKMPSALVEIGFISHPKEGRLLGRERHQLKVARAIADGVRDFAEKVLERRLYAQAKQAASPAAENPPPVRVATPAGTR